MHPLCACPHISQVRPHGGIFIDGVTQSGSAYRINYTLVVNDLSLYTVHGLGAFFAYVNFEVHRRCVCGWGVGMCMCPLLTQ